MACPPRLGTLTLSGLALSALSLSPLAMAAADQERGFYFGVGTGVSSLENNREDVRDFIGSGAEDFDLDDKDNVWKAFVGYDINRYLAVEGFYADLGTVSLEEEFFPNTRLDSTAYGASMIGRLPVTDWFSPYAKLGVARWDTKVRGRFVQGRDNSELRKQDGTAPVYGLGAQFNFDPVLLRAEYERYDFDSDYTIDAFTLSAGLRF